MKSGCNIYFGTSIIICFTMGIGIIYIIRQKPNPANMNFLYNILHHGISRYSKMQRLSHKYINYLYQNKYFKKMNNYIQHKNYVLREYLLNDIEVVKYNNVIIRCKLQNLIMYNPLYMDFFVYSDIHSYPVNKIVSKDIYSFTKKYLKCQFKFYNINLVLSEKYTYNISLSTSHYNYYNVGNVIDKYLLLFLLYQQYGVYIENDNVCYTLEIIDNNMDLIFLTDKDILVLTESSYNIKNVFLIKEDIPFSDKNKIDEDCHKISDNIFNNNKDDVSNNSLSESFVEI